MKKGREFYNRTHSFMNRIGYKEFSPDVLFNGIQDEAVYQVLSILIEDKQLCLLNEEEVATINELALDNVFPSCYYYNEKMKQMSFLKQGDDIKENIEEIREQEESVYETKNVNELKHCLGLAESYSFSFVPLIRPTSLGVLAESIQKVSKEISLESNLCLNNDFCKAVDLLVSTQKEIDTECSCFDLKSLFQLKTEVLLKEVVQSQKKEIEQINQFLEESSANLVSVLSFIQLSVLYLNEQEKEVLCLKTKTKKHQRELSKAVVFLDKAISFLDTKSVSYSLAKTNTKGGLGLDVLAELAQEADRIQEIKSLMEESAFKNLRNRLKGGDLKEQQRRADHKIKSLSVKIQAICYKPS